MPLVPACFSPSSTGCDGVCCLDAFSGVSPKVPEFKKLVAGVVRCEVGGVDSPIKTDGDSPRVATS